MGLVASISIRWLGVDEAQLSVDWRPKWELVALVSCFLGAET